MRSLLLIICLVIFPDCYGQLRNQETSRTWVGLGVGLSGTNSYSMSGFNAAISHSQRIHIFDFKYRFLEEHQTSGLFDLDGSSSKPNQMNELNLQYGICYHQEHFSTSISTGLGMIIGSRNVKLNDQEIEQLQEEFGNPLPEQHKWERRNFIGLNFPLDIDVQWIVSSGFGIELNAFLAVNKEITTGGLMLGIVFGKLR